MNPTPPARCLPLVLGLAASLALPSAHAQGIAPTCHPVGGAILTQLLDAKTGLYVVTGDLAGSARGLIERQTQDGNITRATLSHVFVLFSGATLTTARDAATFTPVSKTQAFSQVEFNVTGGSGGYAGASGHLSAFGAVDFASGQIVMRYAGTVCGGAK